MTTTETPTMCDTKGCTNAATHTFEAHAPDLEPLVVFETCVYCHDLVAKVLEFFELAPRS